jgi:hypothetical protein
MVYFHPWEFDPRQPRLPLQLLNGLRTYWGIFRSRGRFTSLLARHRFVRAIDVIGQLKKEWRTLPEFGLAP